jgi:hypothetical protein
MSRHFFMVISFYIVGAKDFVMYLRRLLSFWVGLSFSPNTSSPPLDSPATGCVRLRKVKGGREL